MISGKQFAVGPDPRFSYGGMHFLLRGAGFAADMRGVAISDVSHPPSGGMVVELELLVEAGHGAFTDVDGYHEIRPSAKLSIAVKIDK